MSSLSDVCVVAHCYGQHKTGGNRVPLENVLRKVCSNAFIKRIHWANTRVLAFKTACSRFLHLRSKIKLNNESSALEIHFIGQRFSGNIWSTISRNTVNATFHSLFLTVRVRIFARIKKVSRYFFDSEFPRLHVSPIRCSVDKELSSNYRHGRTYHSASWKEQYYIKN